MREVYIDDESRDATVVVPDDQLALAIGKEGLNARLAARLTGWKVDIKSDSEFAQQEADAAFAGEDQGGGDFSGRCAALLSNGKRCPNAALPGTRYCGVPAHQALADDPTAAARGAAVPLSDRTAEAADDADAETEGGGVATEIAVAEEVLEELEGALAEGELTVDEAEAAEEVVVRRPRPRSRPRPRRRATTREHAAPLRDLCRVWPPRAEACARPLHGGGRRAERRGDGGRSGRVHVPRRDVLRAGDHGSRLCPRPQTSRPHRA